MPSNRYSGDVFGKNISDSTANDADLAGHYPYSQERWRFYTDSISEANRIFLEYGSDSRYEHQGLNSLGSNDVHTLKPNEGDTLIFTTAERFRYVVGYESVATWAFSINQELASGDSLEVGPTDFTDGWSCRFSGELGPNTYELVQYRGGSETDSKTFSVSKKITKFTRHEWRYAWYQIMGVLVSQSYGFDNWQTGQLPSQGDRQGPEIGNVPISMKVTAASGGLEVYAGSCAWQTKGNIEPITRSKIINTGPIAHSGGGQWEVLYVMRKDPKRNYIQAEVAQVKLAEFSANDNAFVLGMIMSNSKVLDTNDNELTDSNFFTPTELSGVNSILQASTDATQFPDSTGTAQTAAADPGGYQVGYSSLYNEAGAGVEARPTTIRTVKRKLHNEDYLVILGKTSTAGNMTVEIVTEQSF